VAADPFRFIDRWSDSVGDLLDRLLPVQTDPAALAMLRQKLEDRDVALETYLQRWVASISQVGASGVSGATSGATPTTAVSVALPPPSAAGLWRCEGYISLTAGGADLFAVKLLYGATVLDSRAWAGATGTWFYLSGIVQITQQAILAGTAAATLSIEVTRTSGAGAATWPTDSGPAANRVAGTFIPNIEET
jgi:hypothetical protein